MKKIYSVLAAAFLLWGCASSGPGYDAQIFTLGSTVRIQQLQARHIVREKDGHILVNISGTSTSTQVVYYKVDWYDAAGMPVKTILSAWQKASIVKGVPFDWTVVSPSPKAVQFKVLITKNIGDGILK